MNAKEYAEKLSTPTLARSWCHSRVEYSVHLEDGTTFGGSLVKPIWSEYMTGPSLFHLADLVGLVLKMPGNIFVGFVRSDVRYCTREESDWINEELQRIWDRSKR